MTIHQFTIQTFSHCLKMTFSIWKEFDKVCFFLFWSTETSRPAVLYSFSAIDCLTIPAQPAGAIATKKLSNITNIAWKINNKSQFYKKVKWPFKKVFFQASYWIQVNIYYIFNYSFSWFKDYILNKTFSDIFINFFSFSCRLLLLLYLQL